jgi:hypothetical protein
LIAAHDLEIVDLPVLLVAEQQRSVICAAINDWLGAGAVSVNGDG